MRLASFFQLCFFFCVAIVIFTLAINFVNGLNLFYTVEGGYPVGSDPDAGNIFQDITGLSGGMEGIWLAMFSLTGFAVMVIVKMTGSTSMIGVWLFSVVFWTSYSKFVSVVNINGWIPGDFLIMGTVALLFLWVGAIISMLTGT